MWHESSDVSTPKTKNSRDEMNSTSGRKCCGFSAVRCGAVTSTALVFLLAVYVVFPPPELSERVQKWHQKGGLFFRFGGLEISVKEFVRLKDPLNDDVLLLLHGFPSYSIDWIKIWDRLTGVFGRVIAPDFLGFGFSRKPPGHNYSIEEQADLMEAFLESRNIKDVHLLAHDYGDTVAQELLFRYHKRKAEKKQGILNIKSLCLLNGGIFPETNHPRVIQKLLTTPILKDVLAHLMNYYTFKPGFSQIFGPQTIPTEEEMRDYWSGIINSRGHLAIPQLLGYISERWHNRERWVSALKTTDVPVTFIYGPADPVNPKDEFIEKYRKEVPKGTIHILEQHIGHYPQLEDPQNTVDAYFAFLKEKTNVRTIGTHANK